MEFNVSSEDLKIIHQEIIRQQIDFWKVIRIIVLMSSSIFFIYVNSIMFFTLRSKITFRETSRYILFANMLFADSVHLMSSAVLYSFALAYLQLVKAVCALLLMMTAITFSNTPLNLAVMSLERYMAICFPLRHTEIVTQRRTNIAIGVVWLLSSFNFMIDMLYTIVAHPHSFTATMFCQRQWLFLSRWQVKLAQGFNSFCFVAVALIMMYTYIAIMVAARSISTDKDSVRKARRTVLLHLFQLGLCLTSFLYSIIQSFIQTADHTVYLHLQFLNFFSLIILPRCLSPLIYGLRDTAFRPFFLSYFMCRLDNVKPVIKTVTKITLHCKSHS